MNLFKPITFQTHDGRTYRRDERGVVFRISPLKPWANKSEHKADKKARRIARRKL